MSLQSLRWLRPLLALLVVLLTPAAARASGVPTSGMVAPLPLTVTMVSDTALTLDSNNPAGAGPHAMYVAFKVTNTSGASVANLSISLSGFASGISLAGSQVNTQYIGTLAAGASKTLYWFITYPSTFDTRVVLTASVTDGAGGTASGTGPVRTLSMISAQAGGQTTTSSIGAGAVVGQIIPLNVTFTFKGWKAGDTFNLQPAGNETFSAGCFQLVSTLIISADANLNATIIPGTADKQFFVATSASSGGGSSWDVAVRYNFKYLCAGATGTPLPYSNELSGTQLKYASNYGVGAGNPGAIPPAPSPSASFTISKSVSSTQLGTGGTVTYTVSVQNISSFDATIDSIVDVLPATTSFTGIAAGSGVTAANSGSVPSNGATGTIVFRGNAGTTYAVSAGTTLQLKYTVSIPNTAGEYVNSAKAYVGSTLLGTSATTVTVGTADVQASKSGPATVAATDTIKWVMALTNAGPSTAYRVTLLDTLPAGVTFIRASRSGTLSSGIVTWPQLATLASGTTVRDTIFALAPTTLGNISNRIAATTTSYDPTPSNNNGTGASSLVTSNVVTPVDVTPDGGTINKLPGTKYSQTFSVSNLAPTTQSIGLTGAQAGLAGVLTVDSITGPSIGAGRPDLKVATVSIAAKTAVNYFVWYTVPTGDTATARARLRATNTVTAAFTDTGWVNIHRGFPKLSISKNVTPAGVVTPGADLTYSITFNNDGDYAASGVALVENVPTQVSFKLGTVNQTLPSGVSATVAYSIDGGVTWSYTPVDGGCSAPSGYDGCINRIRWSLSAPLAVGSSSSTATYVARVK